jgi:hypothetical protein
MKWRSHFVCNNCERKSVIAFFYRDASGTVIRFKDSHLPHLRLGAVEANQFSGFSILALIAIMFQV